jgi:Rieske Fe-S protein
MQRRKFIKETSFSIVAGCVGCLSACSKSGVTNTNSPTNFSIDLQSSLMAINDTIVQNNVRVVRIATGNNPLSFTAVDQFCTHAAGNLNWVAVQNIFSCPVHGSQFQADGTLIAGSGPASRNLRKYNFTINGNTLIVSL